MDREILFYFTPSSSEALFLTSDGASWSSARQGSNQAFTLRFIESAQTKLIRGEDQLKSYSNFLLGDKPSGWYSDVPHFQTVRYENLYEGIDAIFHPEMSSVEFDFVIQPGANPSDISVDFGNAEKHLLKNGDLLLSFKGKDILIKKPVAYQLLAGQKKLVPSNFSCNESGSFNFVLGAYDTNKELVIDPVVLFATYQGANSDDRTNAIAVDSKGNSYVTGFTTSLHFPTKHPNQSVRKGKQDVFISKISPSGSLVYSTYLGGSGSRDEGFGIAVNSKGEVIVTGETSSSNFPLKSPLQSKMRGINNAFITKLSSNGSRILFSTYFGGNYDEVANAVAVDKSDAIYIAGGASSLDFPSKNPLQPVIGGSTDAFVTKLTPDGLKVIYSTYIGGIGNEVANGIAVDFSGQVYLTGWTDSINFPVKNPIQPKLKGFNDAFVTKINSLGTRIIFSTYFGGSGNNIGGGQDTARDIAVDSSGNIWITGNTTSNHLPVVQPFQNALKGIFDAFVAKINKRGSKILFSTYLGGSSSEQAFGVALDSSDNAYIAGTTHSLDFPTFNSLQQSNHGGDDAFVIMIDSHANNIVFSTYFGGSGSEFGTSIAVSGKYLYISGFTSSFDFPVINPFQASKKGNFFSNDAFIAKINLIP